MDRFEELLYDLGKEIGVDLYPDQNRICQINYQDELHLQLQYDEPRVRLSLATFICEVPPGKYREKLFKETLKSNGEYPRMGTFGYSERNNMLTLFEYVPAMGLTGEKLFKTLQEFIEKALLWQDAVANGKPLPTIAKPNHGGSMFGLK